MGASFTNLQVFADERDRDAVHARVLAAVRTRLAGTGWLELDDAPEASVDRRVVVGPPGRWIAIYDQATEDLDASHLDALAAALSSAIDQPTVSVQVFDSDHLVLGLFEGGARRASYLRDPEQPRRPKAAALVGWQRVLLPGKTVADVAAALAHDEVFVEEKLGELADVVGWEPERVAVGFDHLSDVDLDGLTELRFRRAPLAAGGESPKPTLRQRGSAGPAAATVGQPLQPMLWVQNEGAAFTGYVVAAWGPALDMGLIRLLTARVIEPRSLHAGAVHEAPFAARELNGQTVWVARFPDRSIPQGAPHAAAFRDALGAGAHGIVERAGEAPFFLGVAAIGHPLDPAAAGAFQVHAKNPEPTVPVTLHRPLRHERSGDSNRAQHTELLLAQISTPRVLVACAVLGREHAASAPVVVAAFERWHDFVAQVRPGPFEVSAVLGRSTTPKPTRIEGQRTAEIDAWPSVRAKVAKARSWVASRGALAGSTRLDRDFGDGFGWQSAHRFREEEVEPFAPHVLFWLSLDGLDCGAIDAGERVAAELIDELMVKADGLQGFAARWAWAPAPYDWIGNPYEQACGVSGESCGGRAWNSRFLRAAAERVWLGPELARALGVVDWSAVADVEQVGTATRIRLREGAALAELEALLAPILPSTLDAARASEAYWAELRARVAAGRSVPKRAASGKLAEERKARRDVERSLAALRTGSDRSKVNALARLESLAAIAPAALLEGIRLGLASDARKVRAPAAQALRSVVEHAPEEAREVVIACLADADWVVRAQAVELLERLAAADESAIAMLEGCLDDSSSEVRGVALRALHRLRFDPEKLFQHALAALRGRGKSSKGVALWILSDLGPGRAALLPALARALRDKDDLFATSVAMTIPAVARGPQAAAVLHTAFAAAGPRTRVSLVESLGRLGPSAAVAVPDLLRLLDSSEVRLGFHAAVALARIDPSRREPERRLERTLEDPSCHGSSRVEAAEALLRIDPERRDLVERLLDAARTPSHRGMVQVVAARALGALRLSEAIPVLEALLDERNPESLRRVAAEALRAIDPGSAPAPSV